MPDARLARTRQQYRCNRQMVIVPWQHCQCRACFFARRADEFMRLPMDWKAGNWFSEDRDPTVITQSIDAPKDT